jgi:hypothetical protein
VPTNLNLKGVPDEVYQRLKTSATEQLAAIRATRNRLTKARFDHDLIDRSKREGRA